MQWDDEGRFSDLLSEVLGFYGKDVSGFALRVWWDAMRHYDYEAVRAAFDRHARNTDTGQFVPMPADIGRMLGGRTIDAAQVAWSKVDHAVRIVGPYQSVVFDDALIHVVLQDMGGWILLTEKNDDDWPFVAKEFVERYRGCAMRGEHPEYPPVLIGIAEAHNAHGKYPIAAPILIGDTAAAERVRLGGSARPLLTMVQASQLPKLEVATGGELAEGD